MYNVTTMIQNIDEKFMEKLLSVKYKIKNIVCKKFQFKNKIKILFAKYMK